MSNVEGVSRTLNTLKSLGVRLSVDNFGSGYSSLGYLTPQEFTDTAHEAAPRSSHPAAVLGTVKDKSSRARKCASLTAPARDGLDDVRPGRKDGSAGAEQKDCVAEESKNRFNL